MPISFPDLEFYLETVRVAAGSQGSGSVGLATWFLPARTDVRLNFREPSSSLEDRRRAGRWDREQLIGGKAIEPRK
jgi:hypothetical protein